MSLASHEVTVRRTVPSEVDAVVVGAGFAGLYLVHRFRRMGRSVIAFDTAGDVGGTWYWNRYPGARCDVPTTDYCFSFDPELEREWTWSEKFATQPEILSYLRHVADKHDLRPDIRFSTRVTSARWDEQTRRWTLETDRGDRVTCRFYIMASGCLSIPKELDIEGAGRFAGEVYHTSRWPHEGVDFTGKSVAVIGTGSSGIQSIPLIAAQAAQLTVFQRTPNFTFPAHNGPQRPETVAALAADRDGYREAARKSRAGVPLDDALTTTLMGETSTPEQRRERFEWAWKRGDLFATQAMFADQLINPRSNDIAAELYRERVREIVKDPETAESLCPRDHYMGTKRPCLDTNYLETYNLPHVRLIDVRKHPIASITEKGIDTVDESLEFDAIVYATGFDAMTGALVSVDVAGRDGVTLREKWEDGASTYLGLATAGFPNFFTITGPGSPSVLCNMAVAIEQHVDWVTDCIAYMDANGLDTIEPTEIAETGWTEHVRDCAAITLLPTANSWYMGANVPGKPRMFYVYLGGLHEYRKACDEVARSGYLGFRLEGPAGVVCRDGIIREMQPDVAMLLAAIEQMRLPPMETMSPEQARAFTTASAAIRPAGPQVGAVRDGLLPGPGGDIRYRLYQPHGDEPRPVVVYFHGGGWVIGDLDSDDPLCRDLCVRSGAVVVSVDYRHAPEHRFPAAVDDALAAVRWIAANAVELGGRPGELAVAGWSAGGNLAAGVCQAANALGGPDIRAQLLITPVIDGDTTRPSYQANGEGYGLTSALLGWFYDHYIGPRDRDDPRFAVLRGNLAGLPPAVLVTAQFDPLRDEGEAYAEALAGAGVPVRHLRARGHTHISLTMVDLVLSGARVRAEMIEALRGLLPGPVAAAGARRR
ncbi:MAG TPA: alpha/beta hydrolase fold domain-containing protein [Myxococcota bacterium]|nr:alpha/beta hydrolase fold domain-containing protein [Myxococcota bacterium]